MTEDYNTDNLPDRPDLRNEMSIFPSVLLVLITLGLFAGAGYQYFVKKNLESGQMWFMIALTLGGFTAIYILIFRIAQRRRK